MQHQSYVLSPLEESKHQSKKQANDEIIKHKEDEKNVKSKRKQKMARLVLNSEEKYTNTFI